MSAAQPFHINQLTPLSREEFFQLKNSMEQRGVLPHELVLARAILTCQALYTELAQAGILEGPTAEELNQVHGSDQPDQDH